MFAIIVNLLSVTVYPERNDVDMFPPDILVLKNQIRLIPISEPLHILVPDIRELVVRQTIVGMRIDGNMKDRFLGTEVCRNKPHKIVHTFRNTERSVDRFKDQTRAEHFAHSLVHFFLIVSQCPVQIAADIYFCDHCSLHASDKAKTFRPISTKSTVAFSNL